MQDFPGAGLVPATGSSLPAMRLLQPRTVDAAVAALRDAERPLLLAGGTDLVAAFNEGASGTELIDLSKVDALARIDADDAGLTIGAMVTHHAGSTHAGLRSRAAGFAAAWSRIANPRIRFSATLGGNLMARRVRYEGSLLLTALEARLHVVDAAGAIELTAADVWAGHVPPRALLSSMEVGTADLVWFGYERSLRPLLTLATALRRRPAGVELICAIGTEYLQPVPLRARIAATRPLAGATQSRAVADDLLAQLPADFADPVLTTAYARAAGAALLARQLREAARV